MRERISKDEDIKDTDAKIAGYTKTTPRGKPEKDKILALILYLSGLSMNATVKILGVTAQSVMRWIRKMYDKFITEKPDISAVKEVEMDEMHHYYQKNSKIMDLENY